MGSKSDWETNEACMRHRTELGVPDEKKVDQPDERWISMFDYAEQSREKGLQAIMQEQAELAHLPGWLQQKC